MAISSLRPAVVAPFHAWIDGAAERARETLEFREIRRGVQALLRGGPASRGARAHEGAGKRAALACYVAPLEFLAAHLAACARLASDDCPRPRRIVDLACGLGATGAGIATAFGEPPPLFGVESARAAVSELERTWRAFGLDGRIVRAVPRAIGRGDLVCVGRRPGSPVGDAETALLGRIASCARRGATVLVLDPPTFGDEARHARWLADLRASGAHAVRLRPSIERPTFIRRMDKAARLDHQRLDMRLLVANEESA